MPKIEWSEKFSVGFQEIDEQHKKWIDIINNLHGAIMEQTGGEDLTQTIINEMLEYGRIHFAFEEKFLREKGYPDLNSHKSVHRNFMVTLRDKLEEDRSGGMVLNREVMLMLTNWLQDHILNEDMRYSLFFKAK